MAARERRRGPHHKTTVLPKWMEDEAMLRRILMMRRDGTAMSRILEVCGIPNSQWSRVRRAAKCSPYPGDKLVATAFTKMFDSYPNVKPPAPPMFDEKRAAKWVKEMAAWNLDKGVAPL